MWDLSDQRKAVVVDVVNEIIVDFERKGFIRHVGDVFFELATSNDKHSQ
jgi:hypothetical protein